MFAMTFERDPMRLRDVPLGLLLWVQFAGGWAAAGLLAWLLLGYPRLRRVDRERIPPLRKSLFVLAVVVTALGYVMAGISFAVLQMTAGSPTADKLFSLGVTIGGAAALFAVGLPCFANLAALRFRRIWALAKLSFKEAIRNRVLYAFSFVLLIFLFGSWFIPHKPEEQVRIYVRVVYWGMTLLLLVAAVIVSAFSLPTDIRRQTLHTITTKPVERFEILLGRFLGFTFLMTLVLLLMTTVSAVYVLRGVDPEAAAESLKAREPLYGTLSYENTGDKEKAVNVGREWNYRSYITATAPNTPQQYAVWEFPTPPRSLADRKFVRCEFTFDIYRSTKGEENKGVSCEFQFQTAHFDKSKREEYVKARDRLRRAPNRPSNEEIDDRLAEEFGYYVLAGKDITDYHTQYVDVPGGLFRNLFKEGAPVARTSRGETPPPLQVRVNCKSRTQYVGTAKYDLYWRLDDPKAGGDRAAFTYNFYKGTFGLWMRLCLVIGLSVAFSTYLSGVISMLAVGLLYVGGMAIEFIASIALGTAAGGGPMEAIVRIATRQNSLVPMEESTAVRMATTSDMVFRWFIRRVMDIIPDVSHYDLTEYVSAGFNIPAVQLLLTFATLATYLLPWTVLAYYLIKWREIAAPT